MESNLSYIIAHRGASGYLPEHTLEAAAYAYALGADYIEQDIVLSKDSIPVVMHDIYLDFTTNVKKIFPKRKRKDGHWYVRDFTVSELKKLNVNERLKSDALEKAFSNRYPLESGTFKICTLSEQIELIQGLNESTQRNVGIYPEIKNPSWHRNEGFDISSVTLDQLKDYGYTSKKDKIFFQCFDSNELKRVKYELNSSLPLIQLIGNNAWNESDDDYSQMISQEGIENVSKYAVGIGPYLQLLYRVSSLDGEIKASKLCHYARTNGLYIHPYTIRKDSMPLDFDDFEEMVKWFSLELKVDALFTDFVDLTIQAMK